MPARAAFEGFALKPEDLIPAVGGRLTFDVCGHTFTVTRPRKNCCSLKRTNPPSERARFGTVPQIRRDIAYVLEHERMPPPLPGSQA